MFNPSPAADEAAPSDRRCLPRFERSAPMVLIDSDGQTLEDDTVVQNVSQRGIGFQTAVAMNPGERIRFRLDLPRIGEVTGTAAVRWTRQEFSSYQCGAEIQTMGFGHARRLSRFLSPASSMMLQIFDFVLAAACTLVIGMIVNDLVQTNTAIIGRTMADMVDLIPVYFVIGGCGVAIFLCLKR